jgi:tRNA(Ile)-lysidine synthase
MPARRGRVVRPLLSWTREEVTAYCVENGLSWREDASNDDPRFARNRIRALLASFPGGEANVLRASELHLEDEELLQSLVSPESSVERLRALPPALLRLTLARMAGVPVRDPEACLRGADLGGGVRSVIEHGHIRFLTGPQPAPAPVEFTAPSQIQFGEGVLRAEWGGLGTVTLLARTWRPGDRMRPAGMGGHSKSLQDIFTDRKVPRSVRHRLPVVEADGEIAWVPGVASESFAGRGVRLSWELGSR